jgi:glycosyltransferase involved in cell wall biosynthesis
MAKALGKIVELHIVTHRSDNPLPIENAKIHYLPDSLMPMPKGKERWKELLTMIQPDVVHVNGCWLPWCAYTQKWAQRMGYKVALTPHGMLEPWIIQRHHWTRKVPALWLYQKKAIKTADCIHATAEMERHNLQALGYNNQIKNIPNGIIIDNISLKSNWIKTKKILFMSRVHSKKGVDLLIDAINIIKDSLSGYSVIIAGDKDVRDKGYLDKMKVKVKELNLHHLIEFVGGVYGDKKWDLFRGADLFVLPTHSENFGYVIPEALMVGTPVITSKGAPWQELNTHHCGWWIDNDVDTIAKTLKEAITLPEEEYRQMGIRGRELIENNYAIDVVAEKMKALYEWILG